MVEKKLVLPTIQELLTICKKKIHQKNNSLSSLTLIEQTDPIKEKVIQILNNPKISPKESRSLSCFISSAVGDALGAHTEFSPFHYELNPKFQIKTFLDIKKESFDKRAKLGQWTDDTSMALCLADSILKNHGVFDGVDIRYRFLLWWHCGYNSGRIDDLSFGLGGNIKKSFSDFYQNPKGGKTFDDPKRQDNGNGSIMRLAPVPIFFQEDEKKGMEYAKEQVLLHITGEKQLNAADCWLFLP